MPAICPESDGFAQGRGDDAPPAAVIATLPRLRRILYLTVDSPRTEYTALKMPPSLPERIGRYCPEEQGFDKRTLNSALLFPWWTLSSRQFFLHF